VGEPRQALVGEGRIGGCELGIAIGRQIDRSEALVVQRVREWQRHGGYRIIPVIADVGRAWHDAAADLSYRVMVRWRASLNGVISREGRVTIASISGDRAGAKSRRQHSSEVHMQREPDSRVPV
jgi:hypothetical protein